MQQKSQYVTHLALVGQSMPANSTGPSLLWQVKPALAMLEFSSIARGMLAADAMVKRTPVDLIHAGTVQPGRYLVLVGGPVGQVEEALKAGRETGGEALDDTVWLPNVHADVLKTIHAAHRAPPEVEHPSKADALGIIETRTAPAAVRAGDVAAKGATIKLLSIRLADGLDGKGLVLLTGKVADVEAALDLVRKTLESIVLLQAIMIAQLHEDFARNIFGETRFFRGT
jgi:microcompartment protein CcmL/EutN